MNSELTDWETFILRHREPGNLFVHLISWLMFMGGPLLALFTSNAWYLSLFFGSGAVGAFGAFLIVLAKRRLTPKTTIDTFKDAGVTTSVIFIIVIGGIIFARYLTYTGLIADLSGFLLSLELNKYAYLFAFAAIYLVLGMLIDPIAIMVITLPVMYPILTGVGFDPIWLGVIAIKLAEVSLITPPVGLNVYVVRSASPIPLTLEDVFSGVMPFLIIDVITLLLLIFIPEITLALPNLMK